MVQETVAQEVPQWMREMRFCHILTADSGYTVSFCGINDGEGVTCEDYNDEAICPTCGNPTCPRCAQFAALDETLQDVG